MVLKEVLHLGPMAMKQQNVWQRRPNGTWGSVWTRLRRTRQAETAVGAQRQRDQKVHQPRPLVSARVLGDPIH